MSIKVDKVVCNRHRRRLVYSSQRPNLHDYLTLPYYYYYYYYEIEIGRKRVRV